MNGSPRPVRVSAIGAVMAVVLVIGVLAASVLTAAVASAERPTTSGRAESFAKYGSTRGRNAVLRAGCRTYRYSYAIKPPAPDWALEIIVSDPRRNQIASDLFVGGDDPTQKVASFKLCKRITVAGIFTIRGKLTYNDGLDQYSGFIKTSTFKLCKPPRRSGPRPCSRAQQAP